MGQAAAGNDYNLILFCTNGKLLYGNKQRQLRFINATVIKSINSHSLTEQKVIGGHFWGYGFVVFYSHNTQQHTPLREQHSLCLDGVFPLGVLGVLADLLQGLARRVLGRQGTADGAGLLGTQVDGLVLLALVQFTQVILHLRVHHDVHTGDGLADDTAGRERQSTGLATRSIQGGWW